MARWVTPYLRDRFEHRRRAGLLDGRRRRAEAQREQQSRAEPEGEGDRRRGQDDVAGAIGDEMLREGVARREDVAVEMDAALGHAGGAAGEGDQRRVVAAGVDRRQRLEIGAARLQLALAVVAVIFDEVLDEVRLLDRLRGSRR